MNRMVVVIIRASSKDVQKRVVSSFTIRNTERDSTIDQGHQLNNLI